MVTENGAYSNGHVTPWAQNGPVSQSQTPVTDCEPQPGWHSQLAKFTHTLNWVDLDGCGHALTIRADGLQELLNDLKLVKAGIRQAKQKAQLGEPKRQGTTQEEPHADVLECSIHHATMVRRWSKRTQGSYFSHRLPDCSICYGRERKA